jgi:ribosomal protein S27E
MKESKREKEYKWHLRWSDCSDTEVTRQKAEYIKVVTLAKHSQCRLVNHDEYMEMVTKEEIEPPSKYWSVSAGKLGLINLSYYNTYSDTWDLVNQASEDFAAGWRAHEKYANHQAILAKIPADHEEALKMNREYNRYGFFPEVFKFKCHNCGKRFTVKDKRDRVIDCPNCHEDKYLNLIKKGDSDNATE